MAAKSSAELNEGARLLGSLGISLARIVDALKVRGLTVSKQAVNQWQHGKKLPSDVARHAMSHAPIGIDPALWERPAKGARPRTAFELTSPPPPRAPAPPSDAPAGAAPEGTDNTAELAQEYLVRIQRLRESAESAETGAAQRQWLELERKAIRDLAKLTGQEAAPEAQLVRSPAWMKLRGRILTALEKHPEALRALVDVLSAA